MTSPGKKAVNLVRQNMRLARSLWRNQLSYLNLPELKRLSHNLGLSIASGEVLLIEGKWYVTSAGLLRLAQGRKCHGIHSHAVEKLCDAEINRWVFKAIVYKSPASKGFVGYGDADPSNVSSLVHGAEMRVAETRAVNRALRKAYGIGLCSVEELGALSSTSKLDDKLSSPNRNGSHPQNGSERFQPRLRDQLCLLIRQFNLDANLVKAYAADFCGMEVLSEASRESVESFISHLSAAARENRDALVCKLNSYAQPVEVKL